MTERKRKTIGVFALQGSFAEHKTMLEKLGADVFLIRDLLDVQNKKIDGVILPGGESTTIKKLLNQTGLDKWLVKKLESGLPAFGTCAGMIILADLGFIDINVERNAYGGQLESFEDVINLESGLQRMNSKFTGIFIRAPKVTKIGSGVKVLAKHGDDPVLMQEKNVLVGSFHPELTEDLRIHEYFLKI